MCIFIIFFSKINPTGYSYFLESPISTSVRLDEDRITYVNKNFGVKIANSGISSTYSFGIVGWKAVSLSEAHLCLVYTTGADFRLFPVFSAVTFR
jgi:hypothetical protein